MLDQVINITSAGEGDEVTITMRIEDGKVVALTAKDPGGTDYTVTIQLTPVGSGGGTLSFNLCCCPDPVLGIVCRMVSGPCPPCG